MGLAQRIAAIPRRHDNDWPLWAGPCGDGPQGGITQSMLSRFLSCRERFRLKYVLGLEPHDKWNHRLGYGTMWHVCEQALASGQKVAVPNGLDVNDYWQVALRAHTIDQLTRYPLQQDEISKWYGVCCVQFPEYVKYWNTHPDVLNRRPVIQEESFDVPYDLPSGRTVRLRGRWDSVDEIDGGLYLQENKTKGEVDKVRIERQLTFDLQTMLYLVALDVETQLLGEAPVITYPPIRGVRYNVVRRPLSGGWGSIVRHKARGEKPEETEDHFFSRLRDDYIAFDPDHFFFRIRLEVSERDMQVFRETCLDPLLETVCDWYEYITNPIPTSPVQHALNYRTPFGVYSALEDDGATEYDAYLATGSEVGLRRVDALFPELQ